jgi:hypothetical protein
MDASALERAISTAERSFDQWSFWLFAATLAVVIGLIVEYGPDMRELHHNLRNRKLLIEMIGGALITIGVAGELAVQFPLSGSESDLRNANHRYVAMLQAETEELRSANIAQQALLEKERNERLAQEALAASRMPKPEQVTSLRAAITGKSNLPRLAIMPVNDPEADGFLSGFLRS